MYTSFSEDHLLFSLDHHSSVFDLFETWKDIRIMAPSRTRYIHSFSLPTDSYSSSATEDLLGYLVLPIQIRDHRRDSISAADHLGSPKRGECGTS